MGFCWGGGPPSLPRPRRKVWLHFLPFPQEGTHTPLNLTPKAAASRPGAADRPNWLLPPHAGTRLLGGGVVVPVGGRWLRRLLLGSRIPAPRVPGIQAIGQPLTLLREASRPAGARGGSFVLGLLPAFSTRAPPAAPGEEGGLVDQAWAGVPGEGRAGLQEGTERLRRRPGSALQGTAEGESGPPSPPPSPGLEPPPLPSPAPPEEEARPAFAGEAGQAGAWPSPDPRSPALRLRPRAAASLRPRSLPPSFPVGPGPDLGPPSLVSPSSPFPSPLLCAPGSGAGPVTSNPVWRRRDWPARAIKRATSSFPITHCQSGNRGGPAGN